MQICATVTSVAVRELASTREVLRTSCLSRTRSLSMILMCDLSGHANHFDTVVNLVVLNETTPSTNTATILA